MQEKMQGAGASGMCERTGADEMKRADMQGRGAERKQMQHALAKKNK
jgi:hypothetical protein